MIEPARLAELVAAATGILDEELRRQIEWLGESVVPEIGAALAAAKPTFANTALRDLSPSTTRMTVALTAHSWLAVAWGAPPRGATEHPARTTSTTTERRMPVVLSGRCDSDAVTGAR